MVNKKEFMAKPPSGLGLGGSGYFCYGNQRLRSGLSKFYDTVLQCEYSEIPAQSNILTGVINCTALTDNDITGDSRLTAENLYSKAFTVGVPAVLYTAFTFFVCHFL
jgi:hypothetical protein